MVSRIALAVLTMAVFSASASADPSATTAQQPVPKAVVAQPNLVVPPIDFTPPHRERLASVDDIPSSGTSSQYVHGPNEGPVPGASQYRLGGPPPNAQALLGD